MELCEQTEEHLIEQSVVTRRADVSSGQVVSDLLENLGRRQKSQRENFLLRLAHVSTSICGESASDTTQLAAI
jgi:hypothetical protein